jgi:hypothetical protein
VICWKLPVMVGNNRAGTFQQVAGAGIVAKAGPFPHHIRVLGRSEIGNSGPAGGEALEIVAHRGHGRLLQHHLA